MIPASANTSGAGAAPAGAPCDTWRVVPSPYSGAGTSYLNGVAGTSSRDVWTVGYHGDQTGEDRKTLIRHWNGKAWRAVPAPNAGQLNAVAALSPKNAWAVGDGPTIEHWNGKRWVIVPSPRVTFDPREPARLTGLVALSPSNIWAVGMNWHVANLTLIEHWNGHRWDVVPGPGRARLQLDGIAALSPTNIWAVGVSGRALNRVASEHWNGSVWTREPAVGDGLASVVAVVTGDIWAAGGGTIERRTGSPWNLVSSPGPGTPLSGLNAVTALSSSDVWAVGWAGRTVPGDGYAEHALIEHWNGSSWSMVPAPATGSPDSQLLGAAAVSPSTVWAVGFAGKHRTSNNHTLIERYIHC